MGNTLVSLPDPHPTIRCAGEEESEGRTDAEGGEWEGMTGEDREGTPGEEA